MTFKKTLGAALLAIPIVAMLAGMIFSIGLARSIAVTAIVLVAFGLIIGGACLIDD